MKIEQINLTYVVHTLAGIILLGTIALFGYEVSKTKISTVEPSSVVWKMSPLSPQISAQVQLHRLPALAGRFQRKVLVYAVRQKPQLGKNFAVTSPSSKTYMAMNQEMLGQVSGNQ